MTEYRENTDPVAPDEEVTAQEELNESVLNSDEEAVKAGAQINNQEDVDTAVLLIMNKKGMVIPVTNLDNLKMDRQANAHDVLRMCADVQDQISAIRIIGELSQVFQHIQGSSLKGIAELMNIKMDDNLKG